MRATVQEFEGQSSLRSRIFGEKMLNYRSEEKIWMEIMSGYYTRNGYRTSRPEI